MSKRWAVATTGTARYCRLSDIGRFGHPDAGWGGLTASGTLRAVYPPPWKRHPEGHGDSGFDKLAWRNSYHGPYRGR
jgi:hypothetical protein